MSREKTISRQNALLKSYIRKVVIPNSPYYRELFSENSISPRDIESISDLRRLPFTKKDDLLSSEEKPQKFRDFVLQPDVRKLAKSPSVIIRAILKGPGGVEAMKRELEDEFRPVFLTATTGRSSEPVSFIYTKRDLENLAEAGRRLAAIVGATRDDSILNVFPFAPHLAFWQVHYLADACGIFCVSSGGGKVMGTTGNVRLLERLKPSVLVGMPTFVYHVLREAVSRGARCDALRLLILGGEKVPRGMREKLRGLAKECGASNPEVLSTYAFTESKMAWVECPLSVGGESSGFHLYPDMGVFEIVDPESGETRGEGEPGELVYTPLKSRGSVVLRYRTGDFIDGGLFYGTCPHCGRSLPRLVGNISRSSNVIGMKLGKLKGTLVDFNELESLLDDFEDIGAWQIELRKKNGDPLELDEIVVRVTPIGEASEDSLRERVERRFIECAEVKPNEVIFCTEGEMMRLQGVGSELKEKRIVDTRGEEPRS